MHSEIAAYKEARELQALHENQIRGNQPGDPEKAASVLIEVVKNGNPPLHLFLGQDSYDMAKSKITAIQSDLVVNEKVATSTGF